MSEEPLPAADIGNEALDGVFRRALRISIILGVIASLALLVASGWRNAAMMLAGAGISSASILEWQRLVRLVMARLEKRKSPTSAAAVVVFFVLRLSIFAGVIYVSLKCFRGSVVALLCGLGLAVLAIGWEAIRLLRD
jgi:uncharacterized membrane protein